MKILIIDDEKEICDSLKKKLETEHFIVDFSLRGEEGQMKAMTRKYDLIVLDYNLPDKNGLEVCKELRKQKVKTPIIMLSVNSETSTKVELINIGADDYLTKPFSFDELLARARALLRRPEKINSNIIKIRDLSLDTVKHKVIRGEKEVYLTKKEFALLQYLMKNKGTVLSRGMILEQVWDMNADPFSNTIESHIVSVRKKIMDNDSENRIIKTFSGLGYKVDD